MEMHSVLERLDQRRMEMRLSDRALSIRAGMSGDVIRNWRRRLADGKEAGGANAETLTKIATALEVSPSWLISGDDWPQAHQSQSQGFSEPTARFCAQSDVAASGETQQIDSIARALAPTARHPSAYHLRRSFLGFGLLAGDCVIVDLNAKAPAAGELVLATVSNPSTGEAFTVLRRLLPPYLVASDLGDEGEILYADGDRTVIMATVVASFRANIDQTETA